MLNVYLLEDARRSQGMTGQGLFCCSEAEWANLSPVLIPVTPVFPQNQNTGRAGSMHSCFAGGVWRELLHDFNNIVYTATLHVGSPAREVNLIVDTGSWEEYRSNRSYFSHTFFLSIIHQICNQSHSTQILSKLSNVIAMACQVFFRMTRSGIM